MFLRPSFLLAGRSEEEGLRPTRRRSWPDPTLAGRPEEEGIKTFRRSKRNGLIRLAGRPEEEGLKSTSGLNPVSRTEQSTIFVSGMGAANAETNTTASTRSLYTQGLADLSPAQTHCCCASVSPAHSAGQRTRGMRCRQPPRRESPSLLRLAGRLWKTPWQCGGPLRSQ